MNLLGGRLLETLPLSLVYQDLLEEEAPRFPFMGNPQIWPLTQSPGGRRQMWRAAEPSHWWSSGQAGGLEQEL